MFSERDTVRSECATPANPQHGHSRALLQSVVSQEKNSKAVCTHLILDQELDTLDGGSSRLGDSSRNTTHCRENYVSAHPADANSIFIKSWPCHLIKKVLLQNHLSLGDVGYTYS